MCCLATKCDLEEQRVVEREEGELVQRANGENSSAKRFASLFRINLSIQLLFSFSRFRILLVIVANVSGMFSMIETSAKSNVNVDAAFLELGTILKRQYDQGVHRDPA